MEAAAAEEKRKMEETQREMGINFDPNAPTEEPVDLEKQAESEAPTEIISSSDQPFVWHGSETVGSSDVAVDDNVASSYSAEPEVDAVQAMMTSNSDAREQAIAAAEAAALKVKENAMSVAESNGAGAAADPAPATVNEEVAEEVAEPTEE